MTKKLLICIIALTLTSHLSAQVKVEHIGLKEGLPNRMINTICKDSAGFIWIGSETGLYKYDGISFVEWHAEKTEKNNDTFKGIRRIIRDEKTGNLFIQLYNKIVEFNPYSNNWSDYFVMNTEEYSSIDDFLLRPDGDLYLRLNKLSKTTYLRINRKKEIQKYELDIFIEGNPSEDNQLLSDYKNIYEVRDNKLIKIKKDVLNKYKLYLSAFREGGKVWFFNPSDNSITYIAHGISKRQVLPLSSNVDYNSVGLLSNYHKDINGKLWFCFTGGIYYLDENNKWVSINEDLLKVKDFIGIRSLYIDDHNIKWVATINGLYKITDKIAAFKKILHNEEKDWAYSIRNIVSLPNKNLFIATEDKYGIFSINDYDKGGDIKTLFNGPFAKDAFVLYDAKRNCLWNLSAGYLSQYDLNWKLIFKNNIQLYKNYNQIPFSPIVFISENEILIGTTINESVIYNITTDAFKPITPFNAKLNEYINHIYVLDKNTILVGGKQGNVYYYNIKNDKLIRSYNVSNSPIQEIIKVKDQLWMGTYGEGIYILENDKIIKHINDENGLSNNLVCSMLNDRDKYVWVSSYYGLVRIDLQNYSYNIFYQTDGLPSNEFNRLAKEVEGSNLLFGSINGLVYFNPEALDKDYNEYSRLHFTSLSYYDNKKQGLEEIAIQDNAEVEIYPYYNWFQLDYRLLSYIDAVNNLYSVRLKGYDDNWTEYSNQRFSRYYSVPPGKYILEVKAKDSRGVESKNIISIPIDVHVVWYKSWLAYLTYLALLASLIYYIFNLIIKRKLSQAETDRVVELDSFKNKFYANITHELKTPLTVIQGMAQRIQSNPDEWAVEGAETIKRNSDSLNKLVNEILELRKLDEGKLKKNMINDNIMLYLEYLVSSLNSLAELNGQTLKMSLHPKEVLMDYDAEHISIIINNLISNALKFNQSGGKVELLARKEDNKLFIEIEDNGIGIEPDKLDKIFDRFYQVDESTTRKIGGSGIGLSLAKELIEFYGGTIRVESKVNIGSKFIITLPITTQAESKTAMSYPDSNDGIKTKESQTKLPTTVKPEKHILVVEDNYDVRNYIISCLNGFQVSKAANGKEGLELAQNLIPDLIISDVMMPLMDGFEMTAQLKKDILTDHIPVIMLTAKGDVTDRIEGFNTGADAYLAKPFHDGELLAIINNLLRQRAALIYKFSQYVIEEQADKTITPPLPITDEFLIQCMQMIEKNLADEDLNVESLAAHMNISSRQLRRKLTAISDINPSDLIKKCRLDKAQQLIKEGKLSIKEIAFEVGFNNQAHFSTIYKKEFGYSPSEEK